MRNYLVIILAAFALSACKNQNEFVINGQVENAGNLKKVLLYENDQVIDSAFLNENHEFKFKRVSPEPNFYTIGLDSKNFLIIAQNGEVLDFRTNFADSTNTYEVKGSDNSERLREFNALSNKYGKIYFDVQNEYTKQIELHPDSKDSIYNALMPEFQKNIDAFSKETLEFSNKNKDNLAGFYAIGTLDQMKYESQLIKYAEDIKSTFPNNQAVQAFVKRMLEIKPVSVGQKAPEFELNDTEGKAVKLSSYKGKYVLLDFWASWCIPCRQENPNVVAQYNAFKNKNFAILGVSLDKSKDAWLKAIKDDQLAWRHVSELKEWNSEILKKYKVDAIPASFLLDPNGIIIAKNLHGEELKEFLNKTL